MTSHPVSVLPGAEPFFYRGDGVGCLCLHGFMASPAEVRWLGVHLAAKGFTAYGPRLPGHGSDYRNMAQQRWQDWYGAALDGYHLLRAQCDQVFVAGHSMGGMLGLLLAANVSLAGLAALATPVIFRHRLMAWAKWLKYLQPFTDQTDRSSLPEKVRAEQARRNEALLGRVRYDRWSTAAVAEIYALATVVYEALPSVSTPLLLVYSQADSTVSLENRDLIAARVHSQQIETRTLQHSDHILPQDDEREQVFNWVSDFMRANSVS